MIRFSFPFVFLWWKGISSLYISSEMAKECIKSETNTFLLIVTLLAACSVRDCLALNLARAGDA